MEEINRILDAIEYYLHTLLDFLREGRKKKNIGEST